MASYLARPAYAEHWDAALDAAVEAAKGFFHDAHHARIDKALDMVLENRLLFLRDGSVIVESDDSSPEQSQTYTITKGYCNCPDATYRGPWCKHAIARALMIKASKIAATV